MKLNAQQFGQLPLFHGHEPAEPAPGSHPGQGKLFTNDDLRRGL